MKRYFVKLEGHPVGVDFAAEVVAKSPAEVFRLGLREMMQEFREEFGVPKKKDFIAAKVYEGCVITYDRGNPIYPKIVYSAGK